MCTSAFTETQWIGLFSVTIQLWGTKTNTRMRKWMTGWHDAWESWMVNGDHIVMNAVHIVMEARCWHLYGNSEWEGGGVRRSDKVSWLLFKRQRINCFTVFSGMVLGMAMSADSPRLWSRLKYLKNNPKVFGAPLIFPLVPKWVWHLWFWLKCHYNYWMDWHEIWSKQSLT